MLACAGTLRISKSLGLRHTIFLDNPFSAGFKSGTCLKHPVICQEPTFAKICTKKWKITSNRRVQRYAKDSGGLEDNHDLPFKAPLEASEALPCNEGDHSFSEQPERPKTITSESINIQDNPKIPSNQHTEPDNPSSSSRTVLVRLLSDVPWAEVVLAWACTCLSVAALLLLLQRVATLTTIIASADFNSILRLSGVVMALLSVRVGAQYWQDVLLARAVQSAVQRLRVRVYTHLHSLDVQHFDKLEGGAGKVAYSLAAEGELAGDVLWATLQRGVPGVVQLVVMGWSMVSQSLALTAACLVLAGGMSAALAALGERLRVRADEGQRCNADLADHVTEVLGAMCIVRVHRAEEFECAAFANLAQAAQEARVEQARARALLPVATTLLYGVTVVVILLTGAWAIAGSRLTPAGLVTFLTSLVLLIEPIQACTDAYNEVKQKEAGAARALQPLDETPTICQHPTAVSLPHDHPIKLTFNDVHFGYQTSGSSVLRGVSFVAPPGKLTAIVGSSGSGKSTVAKLALRLYDPEEGEILFGSKLLAQIQMDSLRENVAYLPQDSGLMKGTVSHNIAYGNALPLIVGQNGVEKGYSGQQISVDEISDGDDELSHRIEAAATMAHVGEWAHVQRGKTPEERSGTDTNGDVSGTGRSDETLDTGNWGRSSVRWGRQVGAGGSALSGGQRARVALARAIQRRPRLLVVDEPSASLDTHTAARVMRTLKSLRAEGVTVLLVAHDLPSMRAADHIVVMHRGTVIEQGTHEELYRLQGAYFDLFEKQNLKIKNKS